MGDESDQVIKIIPIVVSAYVVKKVVDSAFDKKKTKRMSIFEQSKSRSILRRNK